MQNFNSQNPINHRSVPKSSGDPGQHTVNSQLSFKENPNSRQSDDQQSNLCKIGYMQNTFNKAKKFSCDLKQSIMVTIQTYEKLSWQYDICPYQMTTFFMHCLHGPAKLCFLRNVKPGLTYEQIRIMMLEE